MVIRREGLAPWPAAGPRATRDVTLKSRPARHESTMTIDGGFVADEPQSFLLTTAAGTRAFCGGDTSLSDDLRTWGRAVPAGPASPSSASAASAWAACG